MLKKATFSPAQPRRAETRRSAGKAAASEEVRRYVPHIVCGRSPLQQVLANGKAPLMLPVSEKLNVEPLSEARTPLADFFSILLACVFEGHVPRLHETNIRESSR